MPTFFFCFFARLKKNERRGTESSWDDEGSRMLYTGRDVDNTIDNSIVGNLFTRTNQLSIILHA